MIRSDNIISVVEAAYRLDLDDTEWLALVGRTLSAMVPPGSAQLAFLYQHDGSSFELTEVLQRRPTTMFTPARYSGGVLPSGTGELAERTLTATTCTTISSLGADVHAAWERARGMAPYGDMLVMTARAGTSVGVGFAVAFPYKSRPASNAGRIWQRIAAHLGAALRIREQLSNGLTTSGAAPGEHLRAICGSDTGPYPSALLDGTEVWANLSRGRYSMVEHFDHQNRHYFVLRRNDDSVTDPRALTEREQEVLEMAARGDTDRTIAERLGVSNSTVATHRARGMEKLGIKSRALLGHFINQMGVANHA